MPQPVQERAAEEELAPSPKAGGYEQNCKKLAEKVSGFEERGWEAQDWEAGVMKNKA